MMRLRLLFLILGFFAVVSIYADETVAQERQRLASQTVQKNTDALELTQLGADLSVEQMANFLVGPGVEIGNIQYTGVDIASGIFENGYSDSLAMDEGVVLSSGSIHLLAGPNNQQGTTQINNSAGDPMLTSLVGMPTMDASILEFDFRTKYNTIGFVFMFGSEEYQEYVGSPYNDVFGLYVNGRNIALIPHSAQTVAINTVNHLDFTEYYIDNPPFSGNVNVEPDGLVVPIGVRTFCDPDVTNHMSFRIADTSDMLLDSWVFIERGTLSSVNVTNYLELVLVDSTQCLLLEDEFADIDIAAYHVPGAQLSWSFAQPAHGHVMFVANRDETQRTVRYTPDPDFNGEDQFIVFVQDNYENAAMLEVDVTVLPVRDAPVCTSLPIISGDFDIGGMVVCDHGDWNDDIDLQWALPGQTSYLTYSYQWQTYYQPSGSWIDLGDAQNSELVIPVEAADSYLRCLVYAFDTGIGQMGENYDIAESNHELVGPVSVGPDEPEAQTRLLGVYPNPMRVGSGTSSAASIFFMLKESSRVDVAIYNIRGQQVRSLSSSTLDAGRHLLSWDGRDASGALCAGGLYFYQLKSADYSEVRKFLVIK
jgi:hypothetical protein